MKRILFLAAILTLAISAFSQSPSKIVGSAKENGSISLTYFGDGAANQGQVYEAFNMAQLWRLPVIYMIENNRYGMGTSVERASATTDLSQRGASFGIPGLRVDGMQVEAVHAAVTLAAEHARSGEGPFILELLTYRYRGHSMSDPAKYRTRDEVNDIRSTKDPIDHVRDILVNEHGMKEDAVKALDKEVREKVNAAAEFAQSEPEPDPEELWTDIVR
jgi:pyruvate dehydrogenase E1 component alpha subunit